MAGSTRKIHVLCGAVHIVLDHGCTAGDSQTELQIARNNLPSCSYVTLYCKKLNIDASQPARRHYWKSPGNFARSALSRPRIALIRHEEVPAFWCGVRWRPFSLCKLLFPGAAWASTDSHWKKWHHHSTNPGIARFCTWHDWSEWAWALGRKFWWWTWQSLVLWHLQSIPCRWVDHPTCYCSRAWQFTWHRLQLCGAARRHIRPTVFLRSAPRRHHVQCCDITDEINNNNSNIQ